MWIDLWKYEICSSFKKIKTPSILSLAFFGNLCYNPIKKSGDYHLKIFKIWWLQKLKNTYFSHFEKKVGQLAKSNQKTKTPKSWAWASSEVTLHKLPSFIRVIHKVMPCWAWVAPLIWCFIPSWLLSAKSWNFIK